MYLPLNQHYTQSFHSNLPALRTFPLGLLMISSPQSFVKYHMSGGSFNHFVGNKKKLRKNNLAFFGRMYSDINYILYTHILYQVQYLLASGDV